MDIEETRIVEVIREQGGTTYITEKGTRIKRTRNKFDVYDKDPREPHDAIHFTNNSDGSLTVYVRTNGKEERVTVPAELWARP